MAKRKPVVWCKPLVCGQHYTVELVDSSCEDLKNCEAVCLWEETRILIRKDLSDERKEHVLAHELFVHAVIEGFGIDHNLREKLGFSQPQWKKFEENLAETYAPALLATLKANGWLVLPKLPGRRARKPRLGAGAAKTRKTTSSSKAVRR